MLILIVKNREFKGSTTDFINTLILRNGLIMEISCDINNSQLTGNYFNDFRHELQYNKTIPKELKTSQLENFGLSKSGVYFHTYINVGSASNIELIFCKFKNIIFLGKTHGAMAFIVHSPFWIEFKTKDTGTVVKRLVPVKDDHKTWNDFYSLLR